MDVRYKDIHLDPPLLKIENRIIGQHDVFFIAEIGQNHQGDLDLAKKLIDAAVEIGADCVKFQKSEPEDKFTKTVLMRPYDNDNSWGKTYGEHKEYLEFSEDKMKELQQYASKKNVLFSASAMDITSLQFLLDLNIPFLKIGSGDANNIPLLKKAAQSGVPMIISTGMQNMLSVQKIYATIKKYHKNFALLHCVSSYPTAVEDVNLKVIELYKQMFPDVIIGYSGHELGIDISIAATLMGANVIERHLTLDKEQKGSDHKCSLLPEEFKSMIEKVKQLKLAMGSAEKVRLSSENECWNKLGKSIVAATSLKAGNKLTENDLKVKVSDPKGIDPIQYNELLGKILKQQKEKDEPITEDDLT